MDNDSAHHANIALHMYLTGDYVSLVDHAGDYLDKPHLHFWLCAMSYKIFGVTSFAYKLPSFLFTILGTYSVYRLGKSLYNNEVGKLAALIIASSFAYLLANNDVRMDAILTASIALATWQLVDFIKTKNTGRYRCCSWLGAGVFYQRPYCCVCSGCSCIVLYFVPQRLEPVSQLEVAVVAIALCCIHCAGSLLLLPAIQPAPGNNGAGQRSYQWCKIYFTESKCRKV